MIENIEVADLQIVGGFNADNIGEISSERSINFYPASHPFGKKPWALHPTQGTKFQVMIGANDGPVRGALEYKEFAYFCSNNSMFKMDSSFVVTPLGISTFTTTEGFVRITSGQNIIVFTDGLTAFSWDTVALTLTPIAIPPGALPSDMAYMDSFFIFIDSLSNLFYVSDIDTSVFNPAQAAKIDSTSFFGVGCIRLKRRLFLFGNISTEVWMDAGSANFPFRKDNNLLFEHGLEARGSLVEGFDRLFYLSRNKDGVDSVKMVQGTLPEDISTYEVNNVIQSLPNTNLAVGTVKKQDGIIFYKITIANRTFVYNVTMSTPQNRLWHEESEQEGTRHIENCHIFFNNKHFIGDYLSSSLFLYDKTLFKNRITSTPNSGDAIPRIRITKVFSDVNYRRIDVDRIQIDMLQGVGIPGTDENTYASNILYKDESPFINLSISVDGGVFYKNRGDAKIGVAGDRVYRTLWTKIGIERQYIFKFVTYNAVPVYFLGGSIFYKLCYE